MQQSQTFLINIFIHAFMITTADKDGRQKPYGKLPNSTWFLFSLQ
jgi:hypothetical protein